jgi:hypothetical protein
MSDIEQAYTAIINKRPALDLLSSYVEGPQPLKYSTERLREAFSTISVHFEINWCSVVVDATLDRIGLNGFDTQDNAANARLDELFDEIHLDIEAMDAHRAALGMTCGYLILWKKDGAIEAYYNDPRTCHVFYDSTSPKVKTYAAKWFVLEDKRQEMTLYYPDRIEHWQSSGAVKDGSVSKSFGMVASEPNPYNTIPVFELKTSGEITKVTSLQDAINKTFADMMVSAEFGAFAQRWAISQADPGDLQNGPNIWNWLPAGDGQGQSTQVGQFTPTPLAPYLASMDNMANAIAVITRTPKHYFMSTGSNVSGEALLAMEAPLVKKVKTYQKIFSAVWQEIAAFMLLLDNGTILAPNEIRVIWERAESIQPLTEAQALQVMVNTGVPLITQLRRNGWTEAEIKALQDDKKDEQKSTRALGQQVLSELRTAQDQSNVVPQAQPETPPTPAMAESQV